MDLVGQAISSEKSSQSLTPSHLQFIFVHLPLPHLNSSELQVLLAVWKNKLKLHNVFKIWQKRKKAHIRQCDGPAATQATVFPSPQKPTFPNSNSIWNQVDEEPINLWMCYLQISIYLFSRLYYSLLTKAPILGLNSGLLIFRGKKAKFRGIFRRKFAEKSADFAGGR